MFIVCRLSGKILLRDPPVSLTEREDGPAPMTVSLISPSLLKGPIESIRNVSARETHFLCQSRESSTLS